MMFGPRYWLRGPERRQHRLATFVKVDANYGRAACICGWHAPALTQFPRHQIAAHRRRVLSASQMPPGRIERYRRPDAHEPLPKILAGAYRAVCRTCELPIEPLLGGGFAHRFGEGGS